MAPGGLVELATPILQTPEEGGDAVIEVRRTGSGSGEVSVEYATTSGTAKAGEDYTETSGTLVFADGETTKFISIPILPDNISEAFQDFKLTLGNPTGGASLGYVSNAPPVGAVMPMANCSVPSTKASAVIGITTDWLVMPGVNVTAFV